MNKRRRFKQTEPLEERLAHEAERLREKAKSLRPGADREALIRKARQTEAAVHMNELLRAPGLQSLK